MSDKIKYLSFYQKREFDFENSLYKYWVYLFLPRSEDEHISFLMILILVSSFSELTVFGKTYRKRRVNKNTKQRLDTSLYDKHLQWF